MTPCQKSEYLEGAEGEVQGVIMLVVVEVDEDVLREGVALQDKLPPPFGDQCNVGKFEISYTKATLDLGFKTWFQFTRSLWLDCFSLHPIQRKVGRILSISQVTHLCITKMDM